MAIRVLAFVNAGVYLALGIYFLVDPLTALAAVGVTTDGPAGLVELRAMYGGLEFAVGIVMVFGTLCGRTREVIWAALILYAGLGGVRALLMLTNDIGGTHVILVTIELAGVALNGAALAITRRRADSL